MTTAPSKRYWPASTSQPCTAHQLSCGLRWTLERTIDALRRLEANLANTGQTVKERDTYTLGTRPGLLNDREAAVLHRALTCSREARAREALIDPAERAAAARLM